MKDQFQRTIDYARISITDRCNLYCTYCRPDHEEMLSHGEILRYEEILRVCKILTTLGIDKFKITGGEPLVRKGCSDFIRELKKTDYVNNQWNLIIKRFSEISRGRSGWDQYKS